MNIGNANIEMHYKVTDGENYDLNTVKFESLSKLPKITITLLKLNAQEIRNFILHFHCL